MDRNKLELPDRRLRNRRCSLFVGGCTQPESAYRNRSSVTEFVTDLVTAGRMNFVVEVFSCEATEEAKQVVVACGVCNVAAKAALQILLRLKASIGMGFQLSVTL